MATAPTSEEIRLTVWERWNRWRRNPSDLTPWTVQPLSGRVVDAVQFDLFCEVAEKLYELPATTARQEDDSRGPLDIIEEEIMGPIMAECDRLIVEGMATVFERYAREYPDAPRAIRQRAAS